MKTILTTALLTLLAAVTIHAEDYQPGVSGFGIRLGFGLATISTTVDEFEDVDSFAGGTIGVFMTYGLTPAVSLQPELLYVVKGAGGSLLRGRSWRHNYIELPVLLKYGLAPDRSLKPSLFVGPAFSLLTSADFKSSLFSDTKDAGDAAESFDFGIVLGGAIDFKRIVFDVRYTIGMMNVYDPAAWNEEFEAEDPTDIYHMADDDTFKNRFLAFTLGYRF